jgi:hypothetical protein
MGIGFAGGSWNGGVFAYNTAVVNVNRTVVTNVYVNTTIVRQTTIINTTNVSYNGGPNGVQHQPAPEEQIAAHEQHTPPTTFQQQHVNSAATDKTNLASNNGGHPTNLAVTKPLAAETHAPPQGFKPPPPRPITELAEVQAPPATVAAAQTATTKTATVAKPVTPPPAKNAITPSANSAVTHPITPATNPPAKPATAAPANSAAPPPVRPLTPPPAKPETMAPAHTAPAPPVKPAPPSPAKPATAPPEKSGTKPPPKPKTPPKSE